MSITSWINYQQAKQSLINETERKLYQSSEDSHKFINNWFEYRFMDINTQARAQVNRRLLQRLKQGWKNSKRPLSEYVNSYDWLLRVDALQNDLVNLSRNYDYIYDLFLIDTDGNLLFSVKRESDLGQNLLTGPLSQTKFAQTVARSLPGGAPLFSDIERYGPSAQLLSGFLTAPLIDDSGDIIGVFAIQLRLDRIFNRMIYNEEISSSQTHYLVAADGLLRSPMNQNLDSVLTREINTEQFELWREEHHEGNQPDEQREIVWEYVGPNGKDVFGVHQLVVINNVRWVLISEIDSGEVLQTSADMAIAVLIVLFFSIFIISIIAIIQAKRITTPLHKLALASHNVAMGKSNQQVDIDVDNEIGQLADAFNNMLSQKEKNEIAIKKSNAQLRNALSELSSKQYALDQHAIVAITDKAGTIIFANDKFCQISGYERDELIGANHRMINSGFHPKAFFTEMYRTISRGSVWSGKICNRNKSGEEYWVDTTITPYKDEFGEVQQYIAIRTDITQQHAFEEQQQLRLKVAAIKLSITNTFAGENSLDQQLSDALVQLFELPHFNLKPKACLFAFNSHHSVLESRAIEGDFSDYPAPFLDQFLTICEQGIHSNELTIDALCHAHCCNDVPPHGHYILPLTSKIEDNTQQKNSLIGVILLFTEANRGLDNDQVQLLGEIASIFTNAILRDKANKLLQRATETAQQNNQLKGEFLASMSHEIRTPMNGVLGMLGLLLNSDLNADQKHKAIIAKSSAESLLVLINDILDFSKVEAGKLELDLIDFNLREMMGDLSEAMALKAHERGVEIILDVTGVEHSMVIGDSGRIRQIATNLLSNAIKFTEQGEIKVTVQTHEKESGELRLLCQVQDSGIGIPENKIATLFEVFTQVDASTTRKYGGTGLGLAISKKLANLMSGDISVTSEFGKGSNFSFTANLKTSQQSQRVLPLVDISKLTLLIVDDNNTNLAVLRGQLEHWGASVVEADNGQRALDLCYQCINDKKPLFDVALLDMQMPIMDGAELGERIRNDSNFDTMKLVMMTSIASQNETQFFADLGFNAYFPKPATTSDLFQALSVVVDNGETLQQALPLVTHDYLASLVQVSPVEKIKNVDKHATKILLVEDNKVNQMVALGVLNELGFNADVAENGLQALEILQGSSSNTPYQLIYMDCQMPVMDGYQTTINIRQGDAGKRYEDIPIIAMTANAMEGDREKCLEVGMDDYIGKPIEPKLLEAKLYNWLSGNVNAREEMMKLQPSELNDGQQDLQVWDQQGALQRLVNNESLLTSLVKTFFEEMPEKIEQLNESINEKDKQQVALLAHNIKGASANLSGLKLAHYCFQLEKLAKEEGGFNDAYFTIFTKIEESYNQLIQAFNQYISATKSDNTVDNRISCEQAIEFLNTLSSRLSECDYIESEEIQPFIDSHFASEINGLLNELQQKITLFELDNAQQITATLIEKLKALKEGNG
ncbi:histidine kinase [Psychromonas sp. psych-6C06]|nr:histidine kinase [Psychromonas sp. psych-6C06]